MKLPLVATLALSALLPALAEEPFRIENSAILTSPPEHYYMQSRGALIPGDPSRVIVTTQAMDKGGTHGYRDLFAFETRDNGRTWSKPAPIASLRRTTDAQGDDLVIGDVCP